MRRHSLPIGIFAVACGLLAYTAPGRAAVQTWVSPTGSDAGNCPVTTPCRTFQFAHNQTDSGGTINVLSSGNFGPLTIDKSISIAASGVEGSILGGGAIGAGIKIQAGANDIVSLRGLTIDLRGSNNIGISFLSGAALHVQDCVIRRSTIGINVAPASGTSELYVADSVIASASGNGIDVRPTGSGGAKAVLDRVRVENSVNLGIAFVGASTTGSVTATVRDSVSAGNGSVGIIAADQANGTTEVMIDHSASVNNRTGVGAEGAGSRIHIGNSTVSGNASAGLTTSGGGVINSYQTNQITGTGVPTNIIPMR